MEMFSASPLTIGESLCTEIEANVTRKINEIYELQIKRRSDSSTMFTNSATTTIHFEIARVINDYLIPIVAIFGLLGNCLNLFVLTRKRLRRTMADRLARSAHAGLVALSVFDALVCLMYAVKSFVLRDRIVVFGPDQSLIVLYIDVYREPVLNVFLLSSTWLTVVMAVERYVAVCRPLHARRFISLTGTRIAICFVFVASVAVNGPRFWHYVATAMPCSSMVAKELQPAAVACAALTPTPCRYYVKQTGMLFADYPTFIRVYRIVYFVVEILIPLPVLSFCNVGLVLALRKSRRLQQQQQQMLIGGSTNRTDDTTSIRVVRSTSSCRSARTLTKEHSGGGSESAAGGVPAGIKASHDRLTRTLIGLILLLIFFVGPSEILAFLREYVIIGRASPGGAGHRRYVVYHIAMSVSNFLLLVNFSLNFVLYCIVNVNFRRTCVDMITCRCASRMLLLLRGLSARGGTSCTGEGGGGTRSYLVVTDRGGTRLRGERHDLLEIGREGRSANDVSGTHTVVAI